MDTKAERKTDKYKEWREDILSKRNHECQDCGSSDRLHIHHEKPTHLSPELFYDESNVIVLCQVCHLKLHSQLKEGRNDKGPSYRTYLKVTVKSLSEESGRCKETIRRHIKSGKLDPNDFKSICSWLDKHSKK